MSINITYTELLKLIPAYLEQRGEAFKAQIPIFINLAENRIATDMKQQGFQAVVTGQMALSNVQPKPVFWRETLSFNYKLGGVWKSMSLRSLEYLKRYWPDTEEKAPPVYYADYNINNFYVAGTPGLPYDFELTYYARLDPLSETKNTNWLTMNAPQALLYATLLEAAMWLKNPAAEQKWMQYYQIAAGGQVTEDQARKEDRNSRVK